ncbi:MAG: hypothetical protein P8O05_02525 [Flavobacteriales bacterium]|nr:hypothetical protein [Flavobacteriales bacterium]
MRLLFLFVLMFSTTLCFSQYGDPAGKPLPEKLAGLENTLVVNHFPLVVHPFQDKKDTAVYHWKHTTSVLSLEDDVIITEFGAYIFYSDKWNERVIYGPKDMDKIFKTKKATLTKGQPYTFKDNWRTGSIVFGGWAMWYFMGIDKEGNKVVGWGVLETTDQIH